MAATWFTPALRADVVSTAWPPPSATGGCATPLMTKVTVPVGSPPTDPATADATVATKVAFWPKTMVVGPRRIPPECIDPSFKTTSYAPQIVAWRGAIEAEHPACKTKIEGKGCEGFEVTCKGARDLTAADQAKGVTARIVSSMRFAARMPDGSTGKAGSAFAEFTKAGDAWTRAETAPVNPSTCAAF